MQIAARGADEWVADLQLNVPGRRLLTGEVHKCLFFVLRPAVSGS
jgi:hypothetical protein